MNLARTRWRRRRLFDTLVRSGRVARPVESIPASTPTGSRWSPPCSSCRRRPGRRSCCTTWRTCRSTRSPTPSACPGTVKARLSRGRAMLAALLSDTEADPRPSPARPAPPAAVLPATRDVQEVRDAP